MGRGYVRPNVPFGFQTHLGPALRSEFVKWQQQNHIPYDPSPTADYDMTGFFQDSVMGVNGADTSVNPYDRQIHFSDRRKTPYHHSFSNESIWANPATAPQWINDYQLAEPNSGRVVYDEIKKRRFGP